MNLDDHISELLHLDDIGSNKLMDLGASGSTYYIVRCGGHPESSLAEGVMRVMLSRRGKGATTALTGSSAAEGEEQSLSGGNNFDWNCATGSDKLFKIYLDSYSDSDKPDATRVIRRLVRDYHYRSSDANRTFELWDNVIESERINIRPFSRYANATINTYFDYEKAALKAPLIEVLNTLKPDSIYQKKAEELRLSMESVNEIPLFSRICSPA